MGAAHGIPRCLLGTPDPDGFDLGGRGGGEALLVEIDGPHALHPDLGRLLFQLRTSGTLSVEGREAFEHLIRDGVGSAMRALRIDDADLLLQPLASDMAALARAVTVGVAAERLAEFYVPVIPSAAC